jgi:hypothetical protein
LLTKAIDAEMTWEAFFLSWTAIMRLCLDLDRDALPFVAPLASVAFLATTTIVRVFTKAQASTLSNNAQIARTAFP